VHHIPRCLVARAGVLILPFLEELVGKDLGLLWACDLASAWRFGCRIGDGYVRGGDAGQSPNADSTELVTSREQG
jgi:hypothetical protein